MAKKTRQVANKSARRQERKQVRKEKQEVNVYAPVAFNPRTAAQKAALQLIAEHDLTFLLGAAGSGKTFLAMVYAINQVLTQQVEKIVLTRPIVEAGEKLGFLPGTFGDKVNPYMQPLYDTMELMLGKQSAKREIINKAVVLAPLCYMRGRSQPLDAKVLTPTGYVVMGDIHPGTQVIGADGLPTAVLAVYPQGELDVYRVRFSDGTSVECSGDHLWQTSTLNEQRTQQKHSVKTTLQIQATLKNKHGQKVHRLPITEPVHFASAPALPLDPYVLGSLLGDGNMHKTASVTLTNTDQELVARVATLVAPALQLVGAETRPGFAPQYRFVGQKRGQNFLRGCLAALGLRGKLSAKKFIPPAYLHASIQARIDLLRGLMDTDGSVFAHRSGNARVQYYSTSTQLAADVRFLVHSLGGTASIRKREYDDRDAHEVRGRKITHRAPCYVLDIVMGDINPFYVQRKATRWKPGKPQRLICAVELVGRKTCQCIRVAAADRLYLTEHCIVTHNKFTDAVCIFDEAQNATYTQLKLFLTRFGQNTKVIVTGDPSQSDLHAHARDNYCALSEVVERLDKTPGVGVYEFEPQDVVRHKLVTAILRKL